MGTRARLYTSRWSGQFAVDVTLAQLYGRCERLADQLAAANRSCLLAYDTRFMSQLFARELQRVLIGRGVPAQIASSATPLTAVQHALVRGHADCSLCVGAGSLPYWYSGLTLISRHQDLVLPHAVDGLSQRTPEFPPPPLDERDPSLVDLRAPYIEMLRGQIDVEMIRRTTMTIFVDAMNGTAAGYLPAVVGEGNAKAIEINREPDPLFGRLTPNPAENGLARLRKLVRESDSHVGVAISADGSALGVVDNAGNQVDGELLLLLLANYLQRQHRLKGTIIAPEACRARIGDRDQQLGVRVEYADAADAAIEAALDGERAALLVGYAGNGLFALGRANPGGDALLIALIVLEMVARFGGKLRALLDELDAPRG
jgi:phosphomannomutase